MSDNNDDYITPLKISNRTIILLYFDYGKGEPWRNHTKNGKQKVCDVVGESY